LIKYYKKQGKLIIVDGVGDIKDISEKWRIVEFNKWWIEFLEIVEKLWEIPLPPYIKEKLENSDRYQTVFNEISWSVAAPTAWLHFTPELLEKIEKKWIKIEKVLLHVWLGTFMWVETENILDHNMHSEHIELDKETANKLNKYKKSWKRIIAVWTTSIRVLESFSDKNWILIPWNKETNIFIYPWYKWKFVDSIITNFHLPKSTLLMLVSSFAWKENIDNAYQYAIKNKFRFFSFGDVMWIK
jgi:S-adenosylmethionine:tRNA ribosyltransferase-isomerase